MDFSDESQWKKGELLVKVANCCFLKACYCCCYSCVVVVVLGGVVVVLGGVVVLKRFTDCFRAVNRFYFVGNISLWF